MLKITKIFLETEKKINITNLPQLPLELAILEINGDQDREKVNNKQEANKKENNNPKPREEISIKVEEKITEELPKNSPSAFKKIIKEWNSILLKTKSYNHSIHAFLKASQPKSLENDTIYLSFLYNFHKDKINEPKNREIVERSIAEVIGKSYRIKCQFDPKTQAKNDKNLEAALEVFGGEIVE